MSVKLQDKKINDSQGIKNTNEITLLDVLFFLKNNLKLITFCSSLGLLLSAAYIVISPPVYQARAQVALAQFPDPRNELIPQGIPIEEPGEVISRVLAYSEIPNSFDACNNDGNRYLNSLKKVIFISPLKNVPNALSIETYGTSQEASISCANQIFDFITQTQAAIALPYLEIAKLKISEYEERISEAKAALSLMEKTKYIPASSVIAYQTDINNLSDQLSHLHSFIDNNSHRLTRLITPIHPVDKSFVRKKILVLVIGLFMGLFLGGLISLAQQTILKLQSQLRGAQ